MVYGSHSGRKRKQISQIREVDYSIDVILDKKISC